jgi:hypothetical protein
MHCKLSAKRPFAATGNDIRQLELQFLTTAHNKPSSAQTTTQGILIQKLQMQNPQAFFALLERETVYDMSQECTSILASYFM